MASADCARNSSISLNLIGKSYKVALSEKIEELLISAEKGGLRNFSSLVLGFEEFVRCKVDPCLESIWVYAALSFFSHGTSEGERFDQIVRISDLFELIVSCSASCNPIKCIALISPVVYVLRDFMVGLEKGVELQSKEKKKINRKIESLLDSMLGYVSVCSNAPDTKSELEDFIFPLGDLVSLWAWDDGEMNKNVSLSDFFPLVGDSLVKRVAAERCGMRELAGIVTAEMVLCKLYWKINFNHSGDKSDELRSWLVGSLTGFRSSYCYVALTSMSLDPVFPTTLNMQSPQDEGIMRSVLFDALVLVEYSFLSPRSLDQLPVEHVKHIILALLMVTSKAIESFSEQGNQTKAISYLGNFTSSHFRSFVTRWIRSKIGNNFSDSEPKGSSPKSYLKWILDIEKRGYRIFDDDMSSLWATFSTKGDEEKLTGLSIEPMPESESDALFYIDTKGAEQHESEEEKKIHTAFTEAARSMAHAAERWKRKTKAGEKRKRMKLVEPHSSDDTKNGGESGGEISNPSSDAE